VILSRHLSFTINRLGLNPTTFISSLDMKTIQKARYHLHPIGYLMKEFIDTAISAIKTIDISSGQKIRYLTISVCNFTNRQVYYKLPKHNQIQNSIHNLKHTICFQAMVAQKLKKLDSSLSKIRDRYGVDMVRWGEEIMM